jgi:hypothetical protein
LSERGAQAMALPLAGRRRELIGRLRDELDDRGPVWQFALSARGHPHTSMSRVMGARVRSQRRFRK